MSIPERLPQTSPQNLIPSVSMQWPDNLTRFLQAAIEYNTQGIPIEALWAAKRGIRLATNHGHILGRLHLEQAIAFHALGKVEEAAESVVIGLKIYSKAIPILSYTQRVNLLQNEK